MGGATGGVTHLPYSSIQVPPPVVEMDVENLENFPDQIRVIHLLSSGHVQLLSFMKDFAHPFRLNFLFFAGGYN